MQPPPVISSMVLVVAQADSEPPGPNWMATGGLLLLLLPTDQESDAGSWDAISWEADQLLAHWASASPRLTEVSGQAQETTSGTTQAVLPLVDTPQVKPTKLVKLLFSPDHPRPAGAKSSESEELQLFSVRDFESLTHERTFSK